MLYYNKRHDLSAVIYMKIKRSPMKMTELSYSDTNKYRLSTFSVAF